MNASLLRCVDCCQRIVVGTPASSTARDAGAPTASAMEHCECSRPTASTTVSPSIDVKQRTAESFAYEWNRYGGMRPEWRKNFLDYMRPAQSGVLRRPPCAGRRAPAPADTRARRGPSARRLSSVDLGDSIDVARRNLPDDVSTIQADAEQSPTSARFLRLRDVDWGAAPPVGSGARPEPARRIREARWAPPRLSVLAAIASLAPHRPARRRFRQAGDHAHASVGPERAVLSARDRPVVGRRTAVSHDPHSSHRASPSHSPEDVRGLSVWRLGQ